METSTPRDQEIHKFDKIPDERETWKEMFENLYNDMSGLWSKESQLIRMELNEKVGEIKIAMSSLLVGGVLLAAGTFSLIATATLILNFFVELWVASAIVTLSFLVIGIIYMIVGKNKLSVAKLKPKHSIDALGEIKDTFQERIYDYKKH